MDGATQKECDVWQGLHQLVYSIEKTDPNSTIFTCVCGHFEEVPEDAGM